MCSAPGPFDPLLRELATTMGSTAAAAVLEDQVTGFSADVGGQEEKAFHPFDLSLIPPLPSVIRSARLFYLPARVSGPKERHPNSHQRIVCLSGVGSIRFWEKENGTDIHVLRAEAGPASLASWSSVSEGVWHQPFAGALPWIGLALHTATANDLVDEYEE